MHDLELEAIIHALNMWRHYLMGRKFELRTNHHGLKYLFDQPNLNVRQARWLELISKFNFDIVYVKGKENRVADTLSRRVHAVYAAAVSLGRSDLKDKVLEALDSDEFYLQIKERIQQDDVQERYKDYALQDGGILKMRGRVYIPNSGELRKLVL